MRISLRWRRSFWKINLSIWFLNMRNTIFWCALLMSYKFILSPVSTASYPSPLTISAYTHYTRRPQIPCIPTPQRFNLSAFMPHSTPRPQTRQYPDHVGWGDQDWWSRPRPPYIRASSTSFCWGQGRRHYLVSCPWTAHGSQTLHKGDWLLGCGLCHGRARKPSTDIQRRGSQTWFQEECAVSEGSTAQDFRDPWNSKRCEKKISKACS